MIVAFLVFFGLAIYGPTLARRVRLEDRLRKRGVWFPAAVWGVAIGLVALSFSTRLTPGSWINALAFTTVIAAPLAAAFVTLSWRDARAGGRPAPAHASPIYPAGMGAPRWVRGAAALIAALGGFALFSAVSAGDTMTPLVTAGVVLLCAYVAVSGRVPRSLARRA